MGTRPLGLLAILGLLTGACARDADGDGYHRWEDCNDGDISVHPGAAEVCDGVDQDCNGVVDDGVLDVFFRDADEDGFGDPDVRTGSCAVPDGFVEVAGDCDDASARYNPGAVEDDCTDPADYNCDGSTGFDDLDGDGVAACFDCNDADADVYSGAPERCDEVDNDCNGHVDEFAIDAFTWTVDVDGDGYGRMDSSYQIEACDQPEGYANNDLDCDDDDPLTLPGAPELCDGQDNDCDGIVDGAGVDAPTRYEDGDGDGYGEEDSAILSCDPVEGYADEAGDCEPTNPEIHPGAVDTCNDGLESDCDPTGACTLDANMADVVLTGEALGDGAGAALAQVGDLTGDGQPDLLVGARYADGDGDGSAEGALYLLEGPLTGGVGDLSSSVMRLDGAEDGDQAGYAVVAVPDVDGDGNSEIVLTAPTADGAAGSKSGAVLLVASTELSALGDIALSEVALSWSGQSQYEYAGGAVADAGDVDGDGVHDLLIGAASNRSAGTGAGAVYLLSAEDAWAAGGDLGDARAELTGEEEGDRAGSDVAGNMDLDGDGAVDVAVGARLAGISGEESGAVYLVLDAAQHSGSVDLGDAQVRVHGAAAGDRAGQAVVAAGDHDGDGVDDLFVGAPLDSSGVDSGGALFVLYGGSGVSGWDGQDLHSIAGAVVLATEAESTLGSAVAGRGDFDDDGSPDLLVAAPEGGADAEGAAWFFRGPLAGTVSTEQADAVIIGDEADDHLGTSLGWLSGSASGGGDALVLGAWQDDLGGTDAGGLFLVTELAP